MFIHLPDLIIDEETKKMVERHNPDFFVLLNETVGNFSRTMLTNELKHLTEIEEKEKIAFRKGHEMYMRVFPGEKVIYKSDIGSTLDFEIDRTNIGSTLDFEVNRKKQE